MVLVGKGLVKCSFLKSSERGKGGNNTTPEYDQAMRQIHLEQFRALISQVTSPPLSIIFPPFRFPPDFEKEMKEIKRERKTYRSSA